MYLTNSTVSLAQKPLTSVAYERVTITPDGHGYNVVVETYSTQSREWSVTQTFTARGTLEIAVH